MKRMEVTEKVIGENKFYLRPFPAFTAVNISGELASVLTPILGGLASVVGAGKGDSVKEKAASLVDADIDDALPVLSKSFSDLSGDSLEKLTRKLLIDYENISVECEATDGKAKILSKDIADEVFCGDVQDMFILCFEVIRLNFNGFFKKIGVLFGSQEEDQKETPNTAGGEN